MTKNAWLVLLMAVAGLAAGTLARPLDLSAQPAIAPAAPASPVAIDLQLTGDANATRVVFTLSAPVAPKVSVIERPDRIVIDLPEVNFQVSPEIGGKGRGIVKSIRYGLIGPGRSRVVIELAQPALPSKVTSEPTLNGIAATLAIDLRKAERDVYAKAALAELPPPPAAPQRVGNKADKRPVVVIDPGHGGIDTGAIGINRTVEKDVVLTFATALRDKLEKNGIRVVLTRDNDSFIALGERVRIARQHEASLFVSIHADTLTVSPEVRGLTVYTNSDRASDAESARLAEIENRADSIAGVDGQETVEEVAGILGDLMLRETRTYSHLFARTLVGQITAASRLNKNPHRTAGFRVLRAPDVPSALIELGYLSSKSDVELLTTAAWRDKATDSITAAIRAFLAPRLAQQAEATGTVGVR